MVPPLPSKSGTFNFTSPTNVKDNADRRSDLTKSVLIAKKSPSIFDSKNTVYSDEDDLINSSVSESTEPDKLALTSPYSVLTQTKLPFGAHLPSK